MDPLTQGALGAALSQATPTKSKNIGIAGSIGFAAGMAADIDILIRSSTDPLMFLEYHRHFTHSLALIPIGGLLCAFVLHWIVGRRWQLSFLQTFIFCTVGYATHGLLDASTSYGTMLFWPFSEDRISLGIVPVIDPLFTLPLVILIIGSGLRKNRMLAWLAIGWVSFYLSMGVLQHNAAISMGHEIAASRGHSPIRLEAKPSFANILVWKTIYETNQHFYVDAVRVGISPQVFYGNSVLKFVLSRDVPWLEPGSQQAMDIQRFSVFSKYFLAADPENPNRIIDVRYSFVPNEISPLWSINVSPRAKPNEHATYRTHRENAKESLDRFWQMLSSHKASH